MITIASYNIHGCIGTDGHHSCDRIIKVINALNADVIALQEVSIDNKNNLLDAFVKQYPEYQYIEGPTLQDKTVRYGNAILTRYPPEQVELVDISHKGREPRGAIELQFKYGQFHVRIVATHLGLLPNERRTQVKKLLDRIKSPTETPEMITILMGDLNEWFLWGKPLRWLRQVFGAMPAIPTYPSKWPFLALDRIWVYPTQRIGWLKRYTSTDSRTASDHLPLVGFIDLPDP